MKGTEAIPTEESTCAEEEQHSGIVERGSDLGHPIRQEELTSSKLHSCLDKIKASVICLWALNTSYYTRLYSLFLNL